MSARRGNLIADQPATQDRYGAALKRGFDIMVSVVGLALLFPLFLLTILAIRMSTGGGAIYRQGRVGRGGAEFQIYKFRTMRPGADQLLDSEIGDDPSARISWETYQKLMDDPRLTRLGRILRKSSLDELPQLMNVLRGEMSLVGPRPILPGQSEIYGPGFEEYTGVRPGMTGLWQVSGRNRLSFEERVKLDREYIRGWSLGLDGWILARTVIAVLRGEGAY